ncbi:GNAT family N-acetyltransferase [Terriglobus aquaticus]|uniref:GNAT family N-acetyltransferase n=1 Tax=Terriglobus aquaticus TaxID=940139 RepID=A0ABW9KL03_9BACT|nr:GNAT family N-acetyltransferase [Terriglobus aquaticus]
MSNPPVSIRPITPEDWLVWERMRYALWPGEDEEHGEVIHGFFAGQTVDPEHVLVAETQEAIVGFAELSIRRDLPELPGKRVGYVEGLYVCEPMRHSGIARALLRESRMWAREQGCESFASDRVDRVILDTRYPEN